MRSIHAKIGKVTYKKPKLTVLDFSKSKDEDLEWIDDLKILVEARGCKTFGAVILHSDGQFETYFSETDASSRHMLKIGLNHLINRVYPEGK